MMKNKLTNKKGFTLIELIVVMAVIAILVLLAAPRFLGYTKDANVTAMKADAKMLSNVALVYNVENESWPTATTDVGVDGILGTADDVVTPGAAITVGIHADLATILGSTEIYPIVESEIASQYKSLKNDLSEYGIVTAPGELEGQVFYLAGAVDKNGDTFFNESK